ncbi:hypothetical protein [Rhodoferax ferrireducens]|nr:hypothetical protein [Rhodoferax ferrireducens]
MIDATELLEALTVYRKKLVSAGHPLKAAAVEHCIKIVRRLSK